MIIWLLLVFYIVFVKMVMGPLDTDKSRKIYLIWVGTATFLVMGLRGGNYSSVYDIRVYKAFYEQMMGTPWLSIFQVSEFELGYAVLNKVLSTFFPFSQTIVLFEAGFCIFSVCYFIYHNEAEVFPSFYYYVTLGSMGFMLTGFRQSIAICICLLGLSLIRERKLIWYLLVVGLAVTMHGSALVFLPLYFVTTNRTISRNRWMLILVVILMMIFAPTILMIGRFISRGELVSRGEAVFSFNGIVPILIYIFSLCGQLLVDKRHEKSGRGREFLSPMLAIGLGLYLMRFYNMALERLAWFYTQASYICLVNAFDVFKKNSALKVLKVLAMFLGFLLFLKRLQTADYAAYTFFWN